MGLQQTFPEFLNSQETLEKGVTELSAARNEGVDTIVDVTTMDLGRDIRLIEEVSRRSGVNVVVATGTWLDIPRVFWSARPDMIAPLYIREIEVGIEGTGIKAGIIKVANDSAGVTEQGEIVLRAAARAQKQTGVPITTHTGAPQRVGEQQVRIFEDEGVNLSRVCIGHSNNTKDVEYLLGLLKKGVWLGLDSYPGGRGEGSPNWEQRTEILKKLIDAGYVDRIMLSHDWSVSLHMVRKEMQEERERYNPDAYLFVTRRVLPRLRELGVAEDDIHKVMVDNPRRFFEGGR
jgi:phosphotriesterase-related protein